MGTQIVSYLFFDGNCREAMEFYQSCLGGELRFMLLKDTPVFSKFPAEAGNLIMHSELKKNDLYLMASDSFGEAIKTGNQVTMMLSCGSEAELRSYFDALSKGGKVLQPLRTEFWGDLYGQLTDKFGLVWLLNFHPTEP